MADLSSNAHHAGVLDAVLLRVIPTILYGVLFYPLMGLRGGATHVTLFFVVQAVFASAVGMLAMSVTIGASVTGPALGRQPHRRPQSGL